MKTLHFKIFTYMVVPCLLALVAGVALTIGHYRDRAQQQSIREINSSTYQISQVLEAESARLASIAQVLAISDDLSDLIESDDRTRLFSKLIRYLDFNRLDLVEVTDSNGVVLANLVDSLCTGKSSDNALIGEISKGSIYEHGLLNLVHQMYVVATIPVVASNDLIGTITVGRMLDEHLIHQLNFIPGLYIGYWNDQGQNAISAANAPEIPKLTNLLSRDELSELGKDGLFQKSLKLSDVTYQCQFLQIPDVQGEDNSVFIVFKSLNFLDQAWSLSLLYNLSILSLVALILIQAIYWMSHHITSPIRKLINSIRDVCEVQFNLRTPLTGKNEVAALTNAFEHLSIELKRNIAKREIYANELKALNQELEHLVSMRTEALENANLQLRREIEKQDDFLRSMSHDLGAPLRNINGLVRLLEKRYGKSLDEPAHDLMKRIEHNTMYNLEIIQRLLEISRLKARLPKFQMTDLTETLTGLKQDFLPELESKNVHIAILDILPTLRIDQEHIRRIFQNLIDNAIKYMEDQPAPDIAIGWSQEVDNYLFWITDNGRGIADEQRRDIFELFNRGKDAAKQDGMGIGLATVKTIVSLYYGEVWVESKIGEGSTFYFTLKRTMVDPYCNDDTNAALLAEQELEETNV